MTDAFGVLLHLNKKPVLLAVNTDLKNPQSIA
jgi:hypothetical protein